MAPEISDALIKLRQQFASQLPKKLDEIHIAFDQLRLLNWQQTEAVALHRMLHSLTGSAGTFGMQSILNAARVAETHLAVLLKTTSAPDEAVWLELAKELGDLAQLARILPASTSPVLSAPTVPPRLKHSPLIYLAEDDLAQAGHLRQALEEDGYRVRLFATTNELRAVFNNAETERPDAIVMDMIFPDGDTAGAVLMDELKATNTRCPPVVFTSVRDDLAARLAAFRAGASRYMAKPVDSVQLISLLDELTGRQPPEPYRILMVDDDPLLLEVQAAMLSAAGMEVLALSRPLEILNALNDFIPDVVVLDVYMPDATGPELAAVLRERDAQLPVLFLSVESDITRQLLALNLGGDDFLVKPVQPEHLVAAVTARARRARQNSGIRRRLETILYEREREHLALNEHAIVSIADRAGNITYINNKFCEISGYTRDELIGQNHRLLKSGEHPPEFYRDLWRTISDGHVWHGEICNRSKDDHLYWVESSITPFLDAEGKPYQYVSIRTDITHVKAAEAELRMSEARLNLAQHVAHLGSYEWDTVTGDLKWSDEHYRLWGLEPGSVTPSFELFRQGIHPDDLAELDANLQKAIDRQEIFDLVYRTKLPDGSERIMHSLGEFSFDDAGKAISLTGTVQDVTLLKRIEQEAEASKERLRRGQIFANIGTWDWNILSGELYWTERIAPLFGYLEGELDTSYANFLEAIHPDDRQSVIDAVNACVERDVPYEIEHRVVWPDGTVRWLLERGAVVRDKGGKPLQMLGVVQDINDRKHAELALNDREQQLREAQTLAHIGNWKADLTTGELTWSDEIYRIFGYEPGSITPRVEIFQKAVHPDDLVLEQESEARAGQTGSHDVVHRIVRPDGTVRHVHELAQAETDGAGKLLSLTGTVQDVTERKLIEQALADRERFLQTLVDVIPAMVGYWTRELRCSFANSAYLDWFGKTSEQMLGITLQEMSGEELFKKNEPHIRAALRGEIQHFEREITKPDGSVGYAWAHYIPDVLKGHVQGFFAVVSDISEIKMAQIHLEELNASLITARDEADNANRAKSEFLSSMSHELRTPMNAILGFGQLLEFDDTLSYENKDSVNEILKAGDHLLTLINEVLDLAKVESGHIDLSLEPVEVCPIVEECLSLVSTLAEKRDIRLSHTGLHGAAVRADRTRLKQVLINLLSNAIKYNRTGGSVHVEVLPPGKDRLCTEQGRLCIRVTDTGPGISAARLAELFQPFKRLDAENSDIEGTGIGLTITRRIVEMMGGIVDVKSEVGIGSTFWIELPLESMSIETHDHVATGDIASVQNIESAVHTVLYIEDNPANLKLVAQVLGRRKHIHLLTAHTPELGIELAMAHHPELILLDINMPGMNGYQVLEVFKANASLQDIPVIAITANAMPHDIKRGIAAGFTDYLTKPLDIGMFYALLDRLLGNEQDLN